MEQADQKEGELIYRSDEDQDPPLFIFKYSKKAAKEFWEMYGGQYASLTPGKWKFLDEFKELLPEIPDTKEIVKE